MSSWTAKFEAFHLYKLKRNNKTDSAGSTVVYDNHFLLGCEPATSASYDKTLAHNFENNLYKYKGCIDLTTLLVFFFVLKLSKSQNNWQIRANAKVTWNNGGILKRAFELSQ